MPRSEPPPSIDWRGWIALVWVAWFGVLYGKMVVESRGGKLRAAVSSITSPPDAAKISAGSRGVVR